MNTDLQVLDSLASLRLYHCPFGPSAKCQLECAYVGQGSRTDNIFFFFSTQIFRGVPRIFRHSADTKRSLCQKMGMSKTLIRIFEYLRVVLTPTRSCLQPSISFPPLVTASSRDGCSYCTPKHSWKLFHGKHSSFGALKSGSTTVLFFFCLLLDKLRTLGVRQVGTQVCVFSLQQSIVNMKWKTRTNNINNKSRH